jgi:hypothetical protein
MPNLIKKIIDVIKGKKTLIFINKELKTIQDLDDFEIINAYQTISIQSSNYLQELINRKISNEFTMFPRDINDELTSFNTDLKTFIKNSIKKEDYDSAHSFKMNQKSIETLKQQINNNRKYILRVK